MTHFLIDTCVFAEYTNTRPHAAVTGWLDSLPYESTFISVLTIGEIEKGILRMAKSRRRRNLELFLEQLLERYAEHVLILDIPTIKRWALLSTDLQARGRPVPIIDSLLAATALECDLTLVTRNERDFADTGVKVLNIWK